MTARLHGGGGPAVLSVQLNRSRTLLLLPKDSPLLGGFCQGQAGWQQRETVPTCCETKAAIC